MVLFGVCAVLKRAKQKNLSDKDKKTKTNKNLEIKEAHFIFYHGGGGATTTTTTVMTDLI